MSTAPMMDVRVGTRVLLYKGERIGKAPGLVPVIAHLWQAGGWHLTMHGEKTYMIIDLTWKRTPPSVHELAQLAQYFYPLNDYVMRITHSDTIRMWGHEPKQDTPEVEIEDE